MALRADQDILERVRGKLLEVFDAAAQSARTSGRAVSLAAYYVRKRERLDVVRTVLHGLVKTQEHEQIFREAERAYFRHRDAFDDAASPSALARAWMDVLVEATEKVAGDRRDAEVYAAVAAHPSREDQEWSDASLRIAGDRWREQ
jgi:hypothetical protein